MQIFVQDDLTLEPIYSTLKKYIEKNNQLNDPFSKRYLEIMRDHFKKMSRESGIFIDPMSGLKFRGKMRRIRIAIYRRYTSTKNNKKNLNRDVISEIDHICQKFETQVRQIGIRIKRLKAKHFYDWLVRWFNPHPEKTNGDIDELLKNYPYPEKHKPFGWNFSQNIFFGSVESYDKGWVFDKIKHKVMVFKELDGVVPIGAISRELNLSENLKYAVLDRFPPGSIYTIQITFESKNAVSLHLDKIESAAIGKSSVVQDIHANVKRARYEVDTGNILLRCVEAIYFNGKNDEELNKIEMDITSSLDSVQLSVNKTEKEIY